MSNNTAMLQYIQRHRLSTLASPPFFLYAYVSKLFLLIFLLTPVGKSFALTPLGLLRPLGRVKRISIAHVRYIQILTRLRGFRDKEGGSRPSAFR